MSDFIPDVGRFTGDLSDLATTSSYRAGAAAARFLPGVVAAGLAVPFGAGASFASPERRAMILSLIHISEPTRR